VNDLMPTCPLLSCEAPSMPEPAFETADPVCDYWRCRVCGWLFATAKPVAACPEPQEPARWRGPAIRNAA
jgi:rubrerythrin